MKPKYCLALLLAVLFAASFALPALANSLPPAITVKTENAPDDLILWLEYEDREDGSYDPVVKNGVYTFYGPRYPKARVDLCVSTGGEVKRLEVTENMMRDMVLNFENGEPKLSVLPSNDWLATLLYALIMIAIEFCVMLLCGYRKGTSFLVFFILNLITSFVFAYYVAELIWHINTSVGFVAGLLILIAVEGLVYNFLLREQSRGRAWLFSAAANIAGALLGSVLTLIISSVL